MTKKRLLEKVGYDGINNADTSYSRHISHKSGNAAELIQKALDIEDEGPQNLQNTNPISMMDIVLSLIKNRRKNEKRAKKR